MKSPSTCNKSLLALVVGGLALSFGASANEDKFQAMDANSDGRVSAAEHAAGARQMFQKMDANSDGRVTAAEMESAVKQTRQNGKGTGMSSAEKIKAIDSNGDGTITAAEHEQGASGKFTQMDADGDGYLSATEMQAGHERLMNQDLDNKTPAPVR